MASAGSALAQNKCAGTKLKAAGKKAACLLGLEAKSAKSGDAPATDKVQKCNDKFSRAFAKAETKGGCLTTGDDSAIEAKVDAFVADVDAEAGTTPPAVNGCQGTKLKAAGKKAKCLLGLAAKAAAKGVAPDPAKVQKCKDKFSTVFAKAEAKGGCTTSDDVATIEGKVDALVDDLAGALNPTGSTTTTSTTSTTTTSLGIACADSDYPECGGSCPGGMTCLGATLGGGCGCVGDCTTQALCVAVPAMGLCFNSVPQCPSGYQCDKSGICLGGPCSAACDCPAPGGCVWNGSVP
jgi:hypothetical protein